MAIKKTRKTKTTKTKSKKMANVVDINGKEISGLKEWKKRNPNKIYFESGFEREAYLEFRKAGLKFDFQPATRELIPKMEVFALSKGKTKKLFKSTVRPISYTSDFAIYCDNGYTVFVETKGFFHKDARLRYKLFQHSLSSTEMSLLAFDTYNKKGQDRMTDVKAIIKIIKDNFNEKKTSNILTI